MPDQRFYTVTKTVTTPFGESSILYWNFRENEFTPWGRVIDFVTFDEQEARVACPDLSQGVQINCYLFYKEYNYGKEKEKEQCSTT